MGASYVTLYAKWSPIQAPPTEYTLSYDANGKDVDVPDPMEKLLSGTKPVVGSPTPTSGSYFEFKNLNTSEDGLGASYVRGSKITIGTSNVILYAQWLLTPPPPPQTGQLPVELFYGIGGLIAAVGVFLKKK